MRAKLFFILFFFLGFTNVFSQQSLAALLSELDEALINEDVYTKKKQQEIHAIKKELKNSLSPEKEYLLNHTLSKKYEFFIADSAVFYTNKSLQLAQKLENINYISESKIQLARIQAKAGLFPVSLDILKTIEKKRLTPAQTIDYYKGYLEVYIYWMEYQEGNGNEEIFPKMAVRDSLISVLPKNSYDFVINDATKNIELENYDIAEKSLLQIYAQVEPGTREFSILNSILAYLYDKKKDRDKQKEYLAKSALSDIQAVVKENVSLRSLAILLFEEGEVTRAKLYIKKSLEDANFYNARLRNIQIARVLPIIDKAYQMDRESQQKKLRGLLITTVILACILLVAILLLIQQMRKVSNAKQKLTVTNDHLFALNENLNHANLQQIVTNNSLAEANYLKEQYIINFFEICTEYIDRLENFKGIVNRKIKTGQTAEILKMTNSSEQSARELKELYKNFDKAFLKIYPKFVEQVNDLLRPDEQYEVLEDHSLNQELRVFALIRLGVTNNNQIASFLHYTLRTIYNYRSKVKSKALNQDANFELSIQHIGKLKADT